jgi:DNA helicase-2/ATP-dependent DNA helicase PcrA
VAQQILDSREAGVSLKNQAVLFRASQHSCQLGIKLVRRPLPNRLVDIAPLSKLTRF